MATQSKGKLIRVAVDAMGGDHAPQEIVAGAILAASKGDVQVLLVGDPQVVQAELAKHDISGLPIANIPSDGVIQEGEPPALALRQKPKASIIVATGLVKQCHADASVTMGSTGAAMAAAVVLLGTIEGIERPALGGPIFGMAPNTAIIDLGANIDCRPQQLLSFAVIGTVFARQFLSVENPRVALLSTGGEAGKGNRQVQEATDLLKGSGLNFIGNLEASDLPLRKAEVVVCDGFVGNIVVKLTESLGDSMANHIREKLQGKLPPQEVETLAKHLYDLTNVTEGFGGGLLFGVQGVSIIGHGRSRADAVARAIGTARRAVEVGFVDNLNAELAQIRQAAAT